MFMRRGSRRYSRPPLTEKSPENDPRLGSVSIVPVPKIRSAKMRSFSSTGPVVEKYAAPKPHEPSGSPPQQPKVADPQARRNSTYPHLLSETRMQNQTRQEKCVACYVAAPLWYPARSGIG